MDDHPESLPLGPWNPGIRSALSPALRPLATIYRPENAETPLALVMERSAFTGLEPEDLVLFRPERLVVHELLIRVTGDFSVPDGNRYADLGINFREIVDRILKGYIAPHLEDIIAAYRDLRVKIEGLVMVELEAALAPAKTPSPARAEPTGFLAKLGFGKKPAAPERPRESQEDRERRVLRTWRADGQHADDPQRRRLCRNLGKLLGAVRVKQGPVRLDPSMLAEIAIGLVMNDHGSVMIGHLIDPLIKEAALQEGYRLLPVQEHPVVMNVKGASAAGKSTLRPLQRELAEKLEIDWAEFALISPDIWRKYLLDYASLPPEAERYAGTFTGHELKFVDQKLDRYMAEKAEERAIPHLLIDRFRFDSFAEEEGGEEGARLLTRFGATVYMFFVITPPDATVERAWKRGLEFGRYKAVDDLLDHNVEAFTGMPRLFFTWALRKDKNVHFEFLDNSVPKGERPRTVAFGWNDRMTILDLGCLLDIERYRRIDITATAPESVYPIAEAMAPARNTGFLQQCRQRMQAITLADQASGRVMARIEDGAVTFADRAALETLLGDEERREAFMALAPAFEAGSIGEDAPAQLAPDQTRTLGAWGKAAG